MRRQAWQAAHEYWRSCEWAPKPFRGIVTVDTVDQYLLGLELGMRLGVLKERR